jgi:hypothetical protein
MTAVDPHIHPHNAVDSQGADTDPSPPTSLSVASRPGLVCSIGGPFKVVALRS